MHRVSLDVVAVAADRYLVHTIWHDHRGFILNTIVCVMVILKPSIAGTVPNNTLSVADIDHPSSWCDYDFQSGANICRVGGTCGVRR